MRHRYCNTGFANLIFGIFLVILSLQDSSGEDQDPRLALPPTLVDKPRAGVLLVASRGLLDPNFRESVVLLTDHGAFGSIGLIVNKPTPMTVAAALPNVDGLRDNQDPLLLGGPVSINSIRLLVRSSETLPDALNITDDVYLVNSGATLEALLERKPADTIINYYAGYAGWAPGQLEFEISRGDWHLVKADGAAIFTASRGSVWRRLIDFLSGQWVHNKTVPSGYHQGKIVYAAISPR